MSDWRADIALLEEAARACCGRCADDVPLAHPAAHDLGGGVRVFCEASRIHELMARKKALPRDESLAFLK